MDSDVRGLGARTVAITPELERYTRAVHRKLNLTFDLLSEPAPQSRGTIQTCFYSARLSAGAICVVWQHSGSLQRRARIPVAHAGALRNRFQRCDSRRRCECGLHDSARTRRNRQAAAVAVRFCPGGDELSSFGCDSREADTPGRPKCSWGSGFRMCGFRLGASSSKPRASKMCKSQWLHRSLHSRKAIIKKCLQTGNVT